jgi:O-antigen/teichoic acid export membrane protein
MFNFLFKESSLKTIFKNSATLLSGNIWANIMGLVSFSLFTHSQGTVLFGQYVLFLSFIEIVDRVFNFQTWQAFIKYANDFLVQNEKKNVVMLIKYSFLVDFFSLIVATFVAIILSPFVLEFYNIPNDFLSLLFLMSLTILFRTAEITTGIFRFYNKFALQAKIVFYSSSIKLGLFLLITICCPKFDFFIYATILSQLITTILKFYFAKSVLKKDSISVRDLVICKIDMYLIKKMKILHFIIYNNFDVTVRMISRQLDTVLIGRFFGSELVGLYKVVKEISNLVTKLTDPVYQTLYPEFAKMLSGKKYKEAKVLSIKIAYMSGSIGLIFYILFAVFGEWSIGIAFGHDFIQAYWPTMTYFIAILIAIITMTLYPLQHAFGYAKQSFLNQLFSTILYIPVLVILTYYFKLIGASFSYIFYYVVVTILTAISVKNGFNKFDQKFNN